MGRNRFRIGLSVALFSLVLSGCNSHDGMTADTS